MFIFIDESGSTYEKTQQKFLVVALALTENRKYPEDLIFKIKDKCKASGKPVLKRELKYHDLTPFQREIAVSQINSEYRNFFYRIFRCRKCRSRTEDWQVRTRHTDAYNRKCSIKT